MPETRKVTLTSERLSKLNQAQRNWILFFGHISNEMSFLQKLLLWSNPNRFDPKPSDVSTMGRAAQSMILARLLIGKQWEAYQILSDSYFANPIRKALEVGIPISAVEGIAKIEATFSDPKSVHQLVRNKFAFHYSFSEFGKNFHAARKAEKLHFIFSDGRHNVLYDASETVINRALLAHIDADLPTATNKVILGAIDASVWFGNYCDEIIAMSLIRAWGDPSTWGMETIKVEAPDFDVVDIPWFSEYSKKG